MSHQKNDNIVRLDPRISTYTRQQLQQLPPCLSSIRQKYTVVLQALLNVFFAKTNDAIFHAADNAVDPTDETALFDANRTLRAQKSPFIQNFLGSIDQAFSQLGLTPDKSQLQADINGFSSDQAESINQVTARNAEIIASLTTRINSLQTKQATPITIIMPEGLSVIFQEQMARLHLPTEAQLCASKVFNEVILNALSHIYDGLEQQLDEYNIPSAKNIDKHFSGKQVSQLILRKKQQATHTLCDQSTAAILNSILNTKNKPKELSLKEQLQILDIVQQELNASMSCDGLSSTILHFTQIQKRLGLIGKRPNYTNELIKLVSIMFELVTNNPQLDPLIKGYINRLLTPAIKTTLLDKEFFTKSQHPLRALLNELITFGLGWTPSENLQPKSTIAQSIDRITSDICANFGSNIDIFNLALNELHRLKHNEEQQLSLLNSRLNNSLTSKSLVENSNITAKEAIEEQLNLQNPPPIVHLFARNLWQRVLTVCALQPGTQSKQWKKHIIVLRKLGQFTKPCQTIADKKLRIEQIPTIMIDIQNGLSLCAHSAFDAAEIIEALNNTLSECLKGNEASKDFTLTNRHTAEKPNPNNIEHAHPKTLNSTASDKNAKPPSISTNIFRQTNPITEYHKKDSNTGTNEPPDTKADQQIRKQALTFTRGMVFDWIEPNQGVIRCRLAAVIKQTNSYIFINRNGMKVAQMNLDELINAIKTQEIEPIEQNNAVFDSALEEVVSGLRRNKGEGIPANQ